jgi:hypothetical protein
MAGSPKRPSPAPRGAETGAESEAPGLARGFGLSGARQAVLPFVRIRFRWRLGR